MRVTYLDHQWHISKVCAKAKSKLGMLYRHFHTADTSTLSFLRWSFPISTIVAVPHHLVTSIYLSQCRNLPRDCALKDGMTPSSPPCRGPHCHSTKSVAEYSEGTHPNPRLNHHDQLLTVPFARTVSFQSSFFVSVVRLWNSLPSEIISCDSLFTFKKHCRLLFS